MTIRFDNGDTATTAFKVSWRRAKKKMARRTARAQAAEKAFEMFHDISEILGVIDSIPLQEKTI